MLEHDLEKNSRVEVDTCGEESSKKDIDLGIEAKDDRKRVQQPARSGLTMERNQSLVSKKSEIFHH